jgi:hypothetical protein
MRCSYCQVEVPEEMCYTDGDRNPICVPCYEEQLTTALHYAGAYVNVPRGCSDIRFLDVRGYTPAPSHIVLTPAGPRPEETSP